jgi:hypothetical protein
VFGGTNDYERQQCGTRHDTGRFDVLVGGVQVAADRAEAVEYRETKAGKQVGVTDAACGNIGQAES